MSEENPSIVSVMETYTKICQETGRIPTVDEIDQYMSNALDVHVSEAFIFDLLGEYRREVFYLGRECYRAQVLLFPELEETNLLPSTFALT